MREILFRGKRTNGGEWVEGVYFPPANILISYQHELIDGVNTFMDFCVIPETVGQYTGLTDENGKKIFEGDIMPVWENGEKYLYKVVYCGDCFMLAMLDSEQGSYPLSIKHNISEVIGNITDNPELLKGAK